MQLAPVMQFTPAMTFVVDMPRADADTPFERYPSLATPTGGDHFVTQSPSSERAPRVVNDARGLPAWSL